MARLANDRTKGKLQTLHNKFSTPKIRLSGITPLLQPQGVKYAVMFWYNEISIAYLVDFPYFVEILQPKNKILSQIVLIATAFYSHHSYTPKLF